MAKTFTQTDTAAQDGAQLACSGASQTAGGSNGTSQISDGAAAGPLVIANIGLAAVAVSYGGGSTLIDSIKAWRK